MELKPLIPPFIIYAIELLIVPYGIETPHILFTVSGFRQLLIVPYGIETKKDGLTIDIESDF